MAIPIRLKTIANPAPAPEGNIHYIIANNGTFLSINNNWIEAIVPAKDAPAAVEMLRLASDPAVPAEMSRGVLDYFKVEGNQPPELDRQELKAKWKLPPMPKALMYQIAKFFREVRDAHSAEVAVILHYGEQAGWGVTVPQQEVTGGHVSYEMTAADRLPGMRMVGTMHSHVDMGAWHSGVDEGDEAQFDGLHVTLGKMKALPEMIDVDGEIVIRGERFKLKDIGLVAEGLTGADDKKVSPDDDDEGYFGGYSGGWSRWSNSASHALVDQDLWEATQVPPEWHDPVQPMKWSWKGGVRKVVPINKKHGSRAH